MRCHFSPRFHGHVHSLFSSFALLNILSCVSLFSLVCHILSSRLPQIHPINAPSSIFSSFPIMIPNTRNNISRRRSHGLRQKLKANEADMAKLQRKVRSPLLARLVPLLTMPIDPLSEHPTHNPCHRNQDSRLQNHRPGRAAQCDRLPTTRQLMQLPRSTSTFANRERGTSTLAHPSNQAICNPRRHALGRKEIQTGTTSSQARPLHNHPDQDGGREHQYQDRDCQISRSWRPSEDYAINYQPSWLSTPPVLHQELYEPVGDH